MFDIESQKSQKLYQNFEVGFDTGGTSGNDWNKNTPQVEINKVVWCDKWSGASRGSGASQWSGSSEGLAFETCLTCEGELFESV